MATDKMPAPTSSSDLCDLAWAVRDFADASIAADPSVAYDE
jgi:hypothetical protein